MWNSPASRIDVAASRPLALSSSATCATLLLGGQLAGKGLDDEALERAAHGEDVLPVLQAGLGHAGAPVGAQLDKPLGIEAQEGFPDQGPADAEALADGILGQLRPGSQGLFDDGPLQGPVDRA